jgi:HPr kinase/phosphorylase
MGSGGGQGPFQWSFGGGAPGRKTNFNFDNLDDIMQMFGVQSIKPTQAVELVISLEVWESNKVYDRIGQPDEFIEILGNKVNSNSVPVRPGRSMAIICESAAISHRQKKMGYNAAEVLTERVMKQNAEGLNIYDNF